SGAIAASGIGAAWAGEAAVKLGGKVPPFERKDSTGRTFKLAETIRTVKAIVLTEWSSRCPVSKKFDPYLNEVAASYAAKGAKLIGIDSNYNEPADEVEKVRKERGLVFPVLMDGEGGQLATQLGASHTPEVYVLDKQGKLVYHGNPEGLREALDELLAGKPISKPETRAFGCSIKRPYTVGVLTF